MIAYVVNSCAWPLYDDTSGVCLASNEHVGTFSKETLKKAVQSALKNKVVKFVYKIERM